MSSRANVLHQTCLKQALSQQFKQALSQQLVRLVMRTFVSGLLVATTKAARACLLSKRIRKMYDHGTYHIYIHFYTPRRGPTSPSML